MLKQRTAMMLDLFPEIEPYSTGYLTVDTPHQIYWEQCGNPDGVPIVFLHGGPGAGISSISRRYYDPDHYRIILFDQRGCGKSTPHASVEKNLTHHIISDIEALRLHLGITRWHIFGGSWGSTLALFYAAHYPDRCLSMILRGIFLLTKTEIDWFIHGMGTFFPEAWEQFVTFLPEPERQDILQSYYKRLTDSDQNVALQAAIQWAIYESACAALIPNYQIVTTDDQKRAALAIAKIEAHYFVHDQKNGADHILNKIETFRHIPAYIVQGRYDSVCPIKTAYALHQAWPEAEYHVVPDGGHSALDPGIRSKLIEGTEKMKRIKA